MKRIFTNTKATLKKTKLYAIYSLIYLPIEMSVRSTHPTAYRLIWFVLISRVRAAQRLPFVITSTGLASLSIHLTSIICLRL